MVRFKDKIPVAIIAFMIAVLVGLYYLRIFEYEWWEVGPYLYDTELFNYTVGPHGQGLSLPPVINMPSFYWNHMSPLLLPFSSISWMLGLKNMQPFELLLLLGYSGGAAAAFVVVQLYLRPVGKTVSLVVGAAFALAFAVSGVMQTTARYPHMEIVYPALAVVALLLIFHRHRRWAWLPFMACLLLREDAGLHITCILAAYLVLAAISERGLPARFGDIWPFMAAGVLYSVFAIVLLKIIYPTSNGFVRIYSGVPAYAHLTSALLMQRVHTLVSAQPQGLATLAAAILAFAFRPRWVSLTGVVAAIPWLVLNVTAFSEAAGNLMLYYAFPFLALVLVPFIVTAELPPPEDVYVDYI